MSAAAITWGHSADVLDELVQHDALHIAEEDFYEQAAELAK
jgi:hypothetical protein